MLMSGATWLIYAMTTATEAPRQPVAVLQYGMLACAVGLIGLAGNVRVTAMRRTASARAVPAIELLQPERLGYSGLKLSRRPDGPRILATVAVVIATRSDVRWASSLSRAFSLIRRSINSSRLSSSTASASKFR
jgi:hypothetical protein